MQSLQDKLEIELLELKCNIHPLDGIAKKSNNILHMYKNDNIPSDTFGRECCAVNFIIAINKMRFKQSTEGFKLFLRQNNIKYYSSLCGESFPCNVSSSWCVVLFAGKSFGSH